MKLKTTILPNCRSGMLPRSSARVLWVAEDRSNFAAGHPESNRTNVSCHPKPIPPVLKFERRHTLDSIQRFHNRQIRPAHRDALTDFEFGPNGTQRIELFADFR